MEERFLLLVGMELSGDISEAERQELTMLLQQNPSFSQQYDRIRQNWCAAENLGNDFNPDAQEAWQKVKGRLDAVPHTAKTSIVTPWFRYLSYAASIILICTIALFTYRMLSHPALKVATSKGEHRKLILPDSSTIWLNESSQVEYAKDFNGQKERHLQLQGEAFFEVTKNPDRQFVVEAGTTNTTVYGTTFNLKASADDGVQVALMEGKVSFSERNGNWSEILTPGEQAYVNRRGQHGKNTFTDTNFMFWKSHSLHFTNRSVQDVLSVVGKSYHTKFILQDTLIARQQITTAVQGDAVQQAIDVLQVLLDVQFIKKGDAYIVKSIR